MAKGPPRTMRSTANARARRVALDTVTGRCWTRLPIDGNRFNLHSRMRTGSWITVDDTGARHKASNGFCTQIGNDDFAWFGTTNSKSRLNFLDLLRAGYTDYAVNDAAMSYMRERALAGPVIARLAAHPDKQFADPASWQAHLAQLGITACTITPDPVQIATEGAHRRYYELCVLSELRDRLRAGDVWVAGSRQYRSFEERLISAETLQELQQAGTLPVAVEADFEQFIASRRALLDEQLTAIDARATDGRLPDVTITNGVLKIAPIEKSTPPEAEALAARLYSMLPRIRITDLLSEVATWMPFLDCFTHLRTGETAADSRVLMAGLLARWAQSRPDPYAPRPAASPASALQLAWTADWHIREETYPHGTAVPGQPATARAVRRKLWPRHSLVVGRPVLPGRGLRP